MGVNSGLSMAIHFAKELIGGEMTGKETNVDRIRDMSYEELMDTVFDSCI